MVDKKYILERWTQKLLANPVTKIGIEQRDFNLLKNKPDLTVFLYNTHGWTNWQRGQSEFEQWLKKGEYKKHREKNYKFEKNNINAVYNKLKIKGTVLDVGGSVGTLREFLHEKVKYICIDPDPDPMASVNVEKLNVYQCLKKPLNFVRACAEFLPFKQKSFDYVHMRSMLDHVQIPDLAIIEANRVLKKNGCLVIGIYLPNGKSTKPPIKLAMKEAVRSFLVFLGFKSFKDHHIWHPTYTSLFKLLNDNDFSITNEIWQEGWDNKVLYLTAKKVEMNDKKP